MSIPCPNPERIPLDDDEERVECPYCKELELRAVVQQFHGRDNPSLLEAVCDSCGHFEIW